AAMREMSRVFEKNHLKLPNDRGFACCQDSWKRFGFDLPWEEHRLCSKADTIMSQAIMDPEQVRRFAEELQRFNRDLQNRMGSLQARFAALGDTWQDQEHVKFADEFKQTLKAIKKFMEMSDQQV